MQRETKTLVGIAALIYTMTNAVLFGAGLITVLMLPGFSSELMIWMPVVVVASIILAAPVAWLIAPRLRTRYWRERAPRRPLLSAPTSAHTFGRDWRTN